MREPVKIAYLEDDPEQSSAVTKWLAVQSLHCHVFDTVDTMKAALEAISFDAIMLDVEIDGEIAGLSMIEYIRETSNQPKPILMVSTESYWQQALSAGADDFLEKPLNAKTLLVHLRRLLRPVARQATIENYPPYQLNATQQKITLEGQPVELSDDQYQLASTLFRHFGKVLSFQQLMNKTSDQSRAGSTRKVESELLKIKRKMDLRDADGWRLEPVYQHGYRLVNPKYDRLADPTSQLPW